MNIKKIVFIILILANFECMAYLSSENPLIIIAQKIMERLLEDPDEGLINTISELPFELLTFIRDSFVIENRELFNKVFNRILRIESHDLPTHLYRDISTGQDCIGINFPINTLAFTDDSIVAAGISNKVYKLHLNNTKLLSCDTYKIGKLRRNSIHVFSEPNLFVSPNGRFVLADNLLFDISASPISVQELNGIAESTEIQTVAFSGDSSHILVSSDEKLWYIDITADPITVNPLESSAVDIKSIALSANGRFGLIGFGNSNLSLLDLAAFPIACYNIEAELPTGDLVAINADGSFAATVQGTRTTYWDLTKSPPSEVLLPINRDKVTAIALSPNGRYLVIAADKLVRFFDWIDSSHALVKNFHVADAKITCLTFSKDGQYFLSAKSDGNLCIWNPLLLDISIAEFVLVFTLEKQQASGHQVLDFLKAPLWAKILLRSKYKNEIALHFGITQEELNDIEAQYLSDTDLHTIAQSRVDRLRELFKKKIL